MLIEAGEGRGVGSGDCDEMEPSRGPLCVLALERRDQGWYPRLGRDIYHDLRCAVHLEMLKPPVSSSRIDTPSWQTSQITRPDSYSFSRMDAGRSFSLIEEALGGWRADSEGGGLLWARSSVALSPFPDIWRVLVFWTLGTGVSGGNAETGKGNGHDRGGVPWVRAAGSGTEGSEAMLEGRREGIRLTR